MHKETELLGCPKCGGMPGITRVHTGVVMIRCEAHPEVPVLVYGEDFAEAIAGWNNDDWVQLGADLRMVSNRPRYKLDVADKECDIL